VDLAGWFARRTFSAHDLDLAALSRRKSERGLSVSVVLPARNEHETITGVVSACAALGGGLVDELVVMDGDSTDGTAELAAAAGARVHADRDVLGQFGPPRGKGDALWRSLAVTSGDIVAFVDTDISNPDPRFVWAVIAPLLLEPEVAFVKAFYDRPLDAAQGRQAGGGGRVTELCARPLINLFWPELAGLVQPLSGEYAGRRDLLESVPFFTGYGVELGLLVDVLAARGVEAIAQTDVTERVHRNQPIEALSRMAFGILQVAAQRLETDGRLVLPAAPGDRYVQFEREAQGIEPALRSVEILERPPMATVAREAR
jgi:glucosyl-3-phosphoglycerate synthase